MMWSFIGMLALTGPSWAGDIQPPPVQLELQTDQLASAPGSTLRILALLHIPEGWHIYWQNPGDSGQATELSLHSKTELQPHSTRWTAPEERLVLEGGVVNYAYTHRAAALVDLQLPEELRGALALEFQADYLICKHACVPRSARASLTQPVEDRSHPSPQVARIHRWVARLPQPLPAELQWEHSEQQVRLRVPAASAGVLFPSEALEEALIESSWQTEGGDLLLILTLQSPKKPTLTGSVLRISYADGRRADYSLSTPTPDSP